MNFGPAKVMRSLMRPLLLLLLIAGPSIAAPEQPEAAREPPEATFHTGKDLSALERCLTERLSKRGDITSINSQGYVTLMYREGRETPMLIDLAPPNVTITTKIAFGTGSIIKSCL